MKQLFATLAQGVSRHEYQGYIIQLTTDPNARRIGHVWEYSDGERIRGFESFAACVDDIDDRLKLGGWEVLFDWRRWNGYYNYSYSRAISFGKLFGKEVTTDWVNRIILVK
jgi:hypothetical protein